MVDQEPPTLLVIAALEASQLQMVTNIASAIPDLALKPNQSYGPATSDFTVVGNAVKLDASDAPGPDNIAWLFDLCINHTLTSLTIYNKRTFIRQHIWYTLLLA